MSLSRRSFLLAGSAAAIAPLLPRRSVAKSQEQTVRVTLLHTNDTHSRIDPFPAGAGKYANRAGVARRATLLKRVRAHSPNCLVLDAGDFFQGTPYFNRYRGEVEIKAMSAMGYDVVTLGNHDFDAAIEGLRAVLPFAQFDIVSANYEVEDSRVAGYIKPYVVKQLGTIKVGVFGLGIAFDGLVAPEMHLGVRYTDPVRAAQRCVEELRIDHGAHMVVALSHLGQQGRMGEPGDMEWPRQVKGVDYVVGGHTHTFLDAPKTVAYERGSWQTLVMQVGFAGINVGRADFIVEPDATRLAKAGIYGVGGKALYS